MKWANLTAVVLSLAFSLALFAQWPAFGPAPDPNSPALKARDGKPDFSGVWESAKGKAKGAANPIGNFLNLGAGFPEALLPYTESALALRTNRLARNSADHPDAHCLPLNPIQLWFHPQPRKWIQTPEVSIMLAEANGGIRQIFTDGRPHPTDPLPWWFGYSTARWDAETLIVESTGFPDPAWIDEQGSPLSSAARVTERIRRPNLGTLEVEITVNDPKYYTRPFTVTSTQRLMPNQELIEFVCAENNTSLKHLVTK